MRRKEKLEAPKIDVLAQHYLKLGLRKHPKAAQHVPNIGDIENMTMLQMLRLAETLSLDPDAVIEATDRLETEAMRYSMDHPAFRGELEFDMTIGFQGATSIRKAKVVYEHTPEWEYFDLRKQTPYEGRGGTMYHIEMLAIPEEYDDDDRPIEGKPYWVKMDDITREDIVPNQMFDDLLEAVDAKCKVEDAERRRVAAAMKTAVKPSSRRKH